MAPQTPGADPVCTMGDTTYGGKRRAKTPIRMPRTWNDLLRRLQATGSGRCVFETISGEPGEVYHNIRVGQHNGSVVDNPVELCRGSQGTTAAKELRIRRFCRGLLCPRSGAASRRGAASRTLLIIL
jgi:hypothetical protein